MGGVRVRYIRGREVSVYEVNIYQELLNASLEREHAYSKDPFVIENVFHVYFSEHYDYLELNLKQMKVVVEKTKIVFDVYIQGEENQKYNGKWCFEFQSQALFKEDNRIVSEDEKALFFCLYAVMLTRIKEGGIELMGIKTTRSK